MANRWIPSACVLLVLFVVGCASKKQAPPAVPVPPAPKQNIFALLADADGSTGSIVVTNSAGAQQLTQPNQAVRLERSDVSPGAPFLLAEPEVKRLFGSALDVLPAPEIRFILYFDEGKDELTGESVAQIQTIFAAVQERRSTAVSVTGHTDTTGDRQSNYELGMRRAERVAGILRARGVDPSSLFIASHGETDLLVKTARGVAEQRNRRVEVVVR